jgi:membrane protein required for colicin V production
MSVLVLLALGLIGAFTFMGVKVGLVRRIVEFAGMIVSFLLATRLAPHWYFVLERNTGLHEKAALYVTWVIIFLLGLIATRLVAWIITKTIRISVIGWLDRLGGALLGLLMGTVLASLFLIFLNQATGGTKVRDTFGEQPYSRVIYQAAPWLLDTFRRLGGDEQEIWDRVRQEFGNQTTVSRAASPSVSFPGNRG